MYASANVAVGLKGFAVTPHNSNDFGFTARTLYIGTTGDVTTVNTDGTTVLWKAVPQGTFIPCECIRVNATGTTAADITGLI